CRAPGRVGGDSGGAPPPAPSLPQGPAGGAAPAGSSACRPSRTHTRQPARPLRARSGLQLPPALRLCRRGLRPAAAAGRRSPQGELPSRRGGRRSALAGRAGGAPPPGPLVEAGELSIRFDSGGWLQRLLGKAGGVLAVDRVSVTIRNGEILGLVGGSGCGKSPLGRLLLRLLPARSGTLSFASATVGSRPDAHFRQRAQVVFQNSDTSLNPRQTVGMILGRAIRWFAIASIDVEVAAEVDRLLDLVRLPRSYAQRYPPQLSGGEKQRVGIARALASRPKFLVCDEAVSALDVSVQAAVLNLLRDLRDELGVTSLFISHDIGVIAHIADRVAVMYQGTIVEEGPVGAGLHPPYHPYPELLLSSLPLVSGCPPPRGRASAAPPPRRGPRGRRRWRGDASPPTAAPAGSARSAT